VRAGAITLDVLIGQAICGHDAGRSTLRTKVMTDTSPILTTRRLTMMPFSARDFGDSVDMRSDTHVTRFVGGISSREDVWSRALRYVGMWAVLGYGYWAVRETATGRFIGEIGFADYKRDTVPNFAGTPESGWVTAAWAHGQGFASEALGAMFGWSDAHLNAPRTICMINPDNIASVRLATKWGYHPFSESSYKGHPVTLFERPRG